MVVRLLVQHLLVLGDWGVVGVLAVGSVIPSVAFPVQLVLVLAVYF
jgi:hypothetical protein